MRHTQPFLTHSCVSLVSLLRASMLPENSLFPIWLRFKCGMCKMCEYTTLKHANPLPSFCEPEQINALTSINQCTENIQLLPIPTSNIHTSPPLTHRRVSLVSLPRASTLPENLFSRISLNVGRAQHEQICVHREHKLICLQMGYTQPLFYSSQACCQRGEVAEGLDTSSELVRIH